MRLIDADAITKRMIAFCDKNCPYTPKERDVMCGACFMGAAMKLLEDAPTIEPERKPERLTDDDFETIREEYHRIIDRFMAFASARTENEERKEESTQNVPKEDLISRKAAIDAVNGVIADYIPTLYGRYEALPLEMAMAIKRLPTAQSEKRTAERTETHACDCISRQAAIDAFLTELTKRERKNLLHTWSTVEVKYFVVDMLEKLPSAQPEQLEQCQIYGGVCGYPSDKCYECPRHSGVQPQRWIPVTEKLPEDLEEVNVTWINHIPEPYYDFLKDKSFTGSAVYYRGDWYWYSSRCTDILAEYGTNGMDKVDDGIEITAWMSLPEPWKEGEADD